MFDIHTLVVVRNRRARSLILLTLATAFFILMGFHTDAPYNLEAGQSSSPQSYSAGNVNEAQGASEPRYGESNASARSEALLVEMRNTFIEARHRAIEKNSCEAAELAAAFLAAYEQCRKTCPPNYMIQNGFTDRVVRNMQWLGDYSVRRCESTSPSPPPTEP